MIFNMYMYVYNYETKNTFVNIFYKNNVGKFAMLLCLGGDKQT